MKTSKKSMLIAVFFMVGLMVASPMTVGCDPPPPVVQETWCEYDLIAGQIHDAGTVKIYYMSQGDDYWLEIHIITEDGWMIDESQVDIQSDPGNFPATKKGNFKIGKFAYSTPTTTTSTQHIYEITDDWTIDGCGSLVIAVHAVVYKESGEEQQWETAWGNGMPFGGNWQMYVYFPCCKEPIFSPTATVYVKAVYPSGDCYWEVTFNDLEYDTDYLKEGWTLLGWCFEKDDTMSAGTKNVNLYSTYGDDIPDDDNWDELEWDRINWIINHKGSYTTTQIQEAIWFILGEGGANNQLAQDAAAYGDGFHPSAGQMMAIIIDTYQGIFFEIDP